MPDEKKPIAQKPNRLGAVQRSAILDEAFALFARQGYRRTSFGDIATAVGLSRPAIYHYFKNKEEVFRAVGDRINKDISLAIDRTLKRPGPLEERLMAIFEARAGRDYALLYVSPFGRELLDEKQRMTTGDAASASNRVRHTATQLIADAHASGEIDLDKQDLKPEKVARLLLIFFEGLVRTEPSEERASAAAQAMVQIFVAGLRH